MMLFYKCLQENYNYGRPAAVTTYDNKQYYQTSIASAQRAHTENYYQSGESPPSLEHDLSTSSSQMKLSASSG